MYIVNQPYFAYIICMLYWIKFNFHKETNNATVYHIYLDKFLSNFFKCLFSKVSLGLKLELANIAIFTTLCFHFFNWNGCKTWPNTVFLLYSISQCLKIPSVYVKQEITLVWTYFSLLVSCSFELAALKLFMTVPMPQKLSAYPLSFFSELYLDLFNLDIYYFTYIIFVFQII